ncbi:MAG TPA: DNA translocase FtsK, partial [Bacillota bacterium]|nr:DNA translocase FtsK [Bacillota bacterium]
PDLLSVVHDSPLFPTFSSLTEVLQKGRERLIIVAKGCWQAVADFIFEVVDEGEKEQAPARVTGPGSTQGKGIIDTAKNAMDDVIESVRPRINVYPEAWNDEKQSVPVQAAKGREQGRIVDHTEEIRRSQEETGKTAEPGKKDTDDQLLPLPAQPNSGYVFPSLDNLARPHKPRNVRINKDITDNIKLLEETLDNFGVKAKVTEVSRGPAITRYELQPAPGVKVSRIVNLADDIALSMATADVRIEAPIPGKPAVGIEVPNKEVAPVFLREVLESPDFEQASSRLTVALGKDIGGAPVLTDLGKMPHLLIAGSTGSGKSVCMNALIASILFKATPHQVKFLMIDPKMVELTTYNGIPHLIAPVVTDPKKAAGALRWVVMEMETRYAAFAGTGVKNLAGYNQLMLDQEQSPLPQIVVLIDELADLMMVAPADVEDAICRLAQMARAAGIHLVVATQRPSVDVITGLIKANIPSRIAFAVSSQVDSRTILDMAGAEKLLGKGDMLFFPVGNSKPVRVQGVYVSEKEVETVVELLRNQGTPEYAEGVIRESDTKGPREEVMEDDLLPEAARLMIEQGQASISLLQRRFRIGYARAARLMDIMEERRIVGGYEGSKPRNVLLTLERWEEEFGDKS